MRVVFRYRDRPITIDLQRREDARFAASVDGRDYEIDAELLNPATVLLTLGGRTATAYLTRRGGQVHVALDGVTYVLTPEASGAGPRDVGGRVSPQVTAPMPGKVLRLSVREGQEVSAGDDLLILEAMKMETRITADGSGTVRRVLVAEGQMVDGGQVMIEIEYRAAG
jgi:biotin carboxyl carrier protein